MSSEPLTPPDPPAAEGGDTVGAVVVAGLINLAIAAAKLIAGLLGGSAAMLSEAAHSAADTVTEVLLYVAARSAAQPSDEQHPLGHGRSSFLWALLASVATFVLGAGFSITHGVQELAHGGAPTEIPLSLAILAISGVLEAVSLRRARQETRAAAATWQISELDFVHATSDTALRAVVVEDAVALVGVALAAVGLVLSAVTDSATWDALASVAIGLLLLTAAFLLARRNLSLLVGRSAPPRLRARMEAALAAQPSVVQVVDLTTEATGPGRYLVLARVRFDPALSGAELADAARDAQSAVREQYPVVGAVYLHPES